MNHIISHHNVFRLEYIPLLWGKKQFSDKGNQKYTFNIKHKLQD